ncbi:MAG: SRPBCC family protein [Bacteroidota bacterium]
MKRKIVIFIFILSGCFVVLLSGMIIFSPYGSHNDLPYKAVKESIEIDAPAEIVYDYLGHSENAAIWSVFVDHISSLNSSDAADGMPGSQRRCFTREDESGSRWDETILIAEYGKKRRLNIFNMHEFSFAANHLLTEQLYEKTGKNSCRLTFTLFFDEGKASFTDELKMYYAAYKVSDIFRKNLQNIKIYTENIYGGK